MNRAISFLGPGLLAAGAWVTAPFPHPWLGAMAVLALALAALVLALVGVGLGRQGVVGAAVLLALFPTFPTVLPMPWLGAVLLAAGALVSLEGARAYEAGMPLPIPRAWVFPLGLALFASLVALVPLTTQLGRESLDIAQGVGLAVSAPLLLGAAWAGLTAFERRSSREQGSSLFPAVLLLVLVLGGFLLAGSPQASAQAEACQDPRQASAFEACPTEQHVLAGAFGQDVTQTTWELNASRVLLMDPGYGPGNVSNVTFDEANLDIEITMQAGDGACASTELVLERALGPWTPTTNASTAPAGEDPITRTPGDTTCTFGDTLTFPVRDHFQAWAEGEPMHGWRLTTSASNAIEGAAGPYAMDAVYDVNAPIIRDPLTDPAPQAGVTMAPIGDPLTVTANITDPKDALRTASLLVGDETAHEAPLAGEGGPASFAFEVTEPLAEGALVIHVEDWDGNTAQTSITQLRPDREPARLDPKAPLEPATEGLRLLDPVPEAETTHVTLNLTDDACPYHDPCVRLDVLDEAGDLVAEGTANLTHSNVTFPLPTDPPGDRALILAAHDTADRVNTTRLDYAVSEPRDPQISNLSITDHLDREEQQEAGLPLHVRLEVDDESAPLHVNVTDQGNLIATTRLDAPGQATLAPVVDTAGTRPFTVTVEDRWGNQASRTHTVEIHPARAPAITLPDLEHIPSEATLETSVQDASLTPENMTVNVIRGGSTFDAVTLNETVTRTGINATLHLPELLHGETLRVTVTATDQHARFATSTREYAVDAQPPTLTVSPEPGSRIGADVWTLPQAELVIHAEDPESGVAALSLVAPYEEALAPDGTTLPVSDIGEANITVHAQDAVGNHEAWEGRLRIDEAPPEASLDVDGHHAVATVHEEESGLVNVRLTANGEALSIPNMPGEHRVHIPGVERGDEVELSLRAEDRVGHTTAVDETVTIQDAPPEVRISTVTGGAVDVFLEDPDGDPVDAVATLTHAVNASQVTYQAVNGSIELPAWRGDVRLTVDATAHEATTTQERSFTLGTPPHLTASVPAGLEPGEAASVPVSWERSFESITLVVLEDGQQQTLVNVTEQGPGEGTAELLLDEEGTYDVELRGQHADGTVATASVGTLEVSGGPNTGYIAVGVLVLIGVMGLLLLNRYRDVDEDEAAPPG